MFHNHLPNGPPILVSILLALSIYAVRSIWQSEPGTIATLDVNTSVSAIGTPHNAGLQVPRSDVQQQEYSSIHRGESPITSDGILKMPLGWFREFIGIDVLSDHFAENVYFNPDGFATLDIDASEIAGVNTIISRLIAAIRDAEAEGAEVFANDREEYLYVPPIEMNHLWDVAVADIAILIGDREAALLTEYLWTQLLEPQLWGKGVIVTFEPGSGEGMFQSRMWTLTMFEQGAEGLANATPVSNQWRLAELEWRWGHLVDVRGTVGKLVDQSK